MMCIMVNRKYLLFSVIFLNFRVCVLAMDTDDSLKKFVDAIISCGKDFPMSSDELEQLKQQQMPANENVKCLFACAYKATGVMDQQGKLLVEGLGDNAQTYFSGDAEKLAKAKEFIDACKSVNDVEVSDGSKGCERAALIFKCSIEKSSQFGFGV